MAVDLLHGQPPAALEEQDPLQPACRLLDADSLAADIRL